MISKICNSYIMVCPSVRGDNPRDLASDYLTYRLTNMVKLFYTNYTHAKEKKATLRFL